MATYYSDVSADPSRMYDTPGVSLKQPFFLTTTALLVAGDILNLCPILTNCTVTGYQVDFPALDTATQTATAKLGITGSDAIFVASGDTLVRAAGRYSSTGSATAGTTFIGCLNNALPRVFTTPNSLILTMVAAVSTSCVVGTIIRGWLEYTMQPKYRKPRRA